MPQRKPDLGVSNTSGTYQIDSARNAGEQPPAIIPVVELITHRFLAGAPIPYLAKKYEDMGRERIENIIRFGNNRIIRAMRDANARLRTENADLRMQLAARERKAAA